jgi:hypothetical protein
MFGPVTVASTPGWRRFRRQDGTFGHIPRLHRLALGDLAGPKLSVCRLERGKPMDLRQSLTAS